VHWPALHASHRLARCGFFALSSLLFFSVCRQNHPGRHHHQHRTHCCRNVCCARPLYQIRRHLHLNAPSPAIPAAASIQCPPGRCGSTGIAFGALGAARGAPRGSVAVPAGAAAGRGLPGAAFRRAIAGYIGRSDSCEDLPAMASVDPCDDVSSRQTAIVAYSLLLWALAYLAARKS